jgi:hypothetical protein
MDIKVYSCYIPMIFNVRMIGLPISWSYMQNVSMMVEHWMKLGLVFW